MRAINRPAFRDAADYLVRTAGTVPQDAWNEPALAYARRLGAEPKWRSPGFSEWTLRDLAAHASRAMSVLTAQLAQPKPARVEYEDLSKYFYFGRGRPLAEANALIVQGGRGASASLGHDPAAAIADLRDQAIEALDAASDDCLVATAIGAMRLSEYLPTRTYALVAHTIDLQAAIGRPEEPPEAAAAETLEVLTRLAIRSERAAASIAALTDRSDDRINLLL